MYALGIAYRKHKEMELKIGYYHSLVSYSVKFVVSSLRFK